MTPSLLVESLGKTQETLTKLIRFINVTEILFGDSMKLLIAILIALLTEAEASSQPRQTIPDLTLRVGVRQRENGKLDKGIHVLTLQCDSGQCSLSSVSLNQCSTSPLGKPTFPAVVQVSSTRAGTLSVTNQGKMLKVEEKFGDIGGFWYEHFSFRLRNQRHSPPYKF
jgi:hypothetical protein